VRDINTNILEPKDILKLSVFAGEIMLKNGAEVYRVEDSMTRILKHFNFEIAESFVTVTAIVATIEDKNAGIITLCRRITSRTNNLEKLVLVNQFSRDICENKIKLDDAFDILNTIDQKPAYNKNLLILATAITSFGFAIMFDGNIHDAVAAFITSASVDFLKRKLFKRKSFNMILDLTSGFLIGIIAMLLMTLKIGTNFDIIIVSAVMVYLPGLLLTNGIRDIYAEDFLSGSAKFVNALLISISLATGVGTALTIWFGIFGGL